MKRNNSRNYSQLHKAVSSRSYIAGTPPRCHQKTIVITDSYLHTEFGILLVMYLVKRCIFNAVQGEGAMKAKLNVPTLFHAGIRGMTWMVLSTISMVVVLFAAWSSCCLWQGVVSSMHNLA
jgi:hypothetical protein